jgi:N-acetylglutamate synthase-like GNAT family acetyltransferase
MNTGVQLRKALPADLRQIHRLLVLNDMLGEVDAQDCVVAESMGELTGFARLELADGLPYIRPIVVAPDAQGQGVGRELVQYLLLSYPRLRVIARGDALGFYTRLGFQQIEWEQVYPVFVQECRDCPHLPSCSPQPLAFHSGINPPAV